MKVLFYRYGSICEPDIIETFREFGFLVTELTAEVTKKDFSPKDGIDLVSRTLLNDPHDFIFSINFYPFLSEVCNVFHLRYLCWIVDSPVMELYSDAVKNPWNRIFLFDRTLYEEIAPKNPSCIFHLPLAVNVRQKQDVITHASGSLTDRFASDISFVGSLYTEKCAYDRLKDAPEYLDGYLNGLMEAQLLVYGYYFIDDLLTDDIVSDFKSHFPGFYTPPYANRITDRVSLSQLYIGTKISCMERLRAMKTLSEQFTVDLYTGSDTSMLPQIKNKGLAKTLTEMPLIFHGSRINLNITAKSIRSALPLRIWDIMGCGGFCLTNFQSEIPDHFVIGEDLDTYSTMEELTEKCAYYLGHESERRAIAENGYEKILKYHTYLIRLSSLVETAFSANEHSYSKEDTSHES